MENKIIHGDNLDVMPSFDANRFDCIATDPPYGLSFMGRDWDKAVPSVAIWKECLRVLKPGAFASVMCIPRQDCLAHMIVNLGDAGFNVGFSSIYWTYATGFPKALNLGKSNKKLEGAYGGFQPKPAVEIIIVAMKPIEEKTYVDQAMLNMHGCTWLDNCRIPYVSEGDKNHREKDVAYRIKNDIPPTKSDINNGVGAFVNADNKGRFPANVLCEDDVLNDGIERVSKWGETKAAKNKKYESIFCGDEKRSEKCDKFIGDMGSFSRYFSLDAWFAERIKQIETAPCCICGYEEEHGNYIDSNGRAYCDECLISGDCVDIHHLDIEKLPKEAQKTFPWLIVPKASKREKGEDNKHPTVKPIKLMSWLIILGTREGDLVLDPFCGSGTTAAAAKILGRDSICIEREKENCEIARKRVSAIPDNLTGFKQ